MTKKEVPKSSEKKLGRPLFAKESSGRTADGSLRFVLVLPPDLADLFEAEMEEQLRKKLPLARFIIAKYFRNKLIAAERTSAFFNRAQNEPVPGAEQNEQASGY